MIRMGCGPASGTVIVPDDIGYPYVLDGDPPTKKKGWYILKIDDDMAFGCFMNHREGIKHPYSNKSPKQYTKEERDIWKSRRDAAKTVFESNVKLEHENVAREAKLIWDRGTPADPEHPYLVRKKITGEMIRQDKEDLIIPMYAEDRFWGIQRITPDGDKYFGNGARKKGCYMAFFHADDDKSRLIICEGIATAKSIRESISVPVIAAFDAGNLIPVAKEIRRKYSDSQIIIAADNDQWTKNPKGELTNPGLNFASQAAGSIGGAHVVYPDFPADDAEKRKDFNDLFVSEGPESVMERINAVPAKTPSIQTPSSAPDIHWKSKALWKNAENNELKDISFNYALIIGEHPAMEGVFAWDEFHLCVMMVKCPVWQDSNKFLVHRLTDQDIRDTDYFLQRLGHNLKGSEDRTRGGIYTAAAKNKIHPARDYFDAQVWDKKPRLDTWLINYCGAKDDDQDYIRAVGRTWLIAAAMRIYEPGAKFDHMLILEGKQGIMKSTLLKELATFGEQKNARSYFTDTFKIKNCTDKDELAKLNGCLIVELAEMSGFNKSDRDELTSFVTTVQDTYRSPYGRELQSYPRQFVLAGTYNPVYGIFTDPTGHRRYWCVGVKKIDMAALRADKNQLWAEAVYRYKSGESLVLSPEIYAKAEIAAADRRIIDDWTQDVLEFVQRRSFVEVRDVLKGLGIEIKGRTQKESRRICDILKSEGFERSRRKIGNNVVWGWSPPGVQDDLFVDHNEQVLEEEIPFF